MRCPSCRQRAVGLLTWIGHNLYQPSWKKDRYQATCRSCGAVLVPARGEELKGWMLTALGVGLGIGVASWIGSVAAIVPALLGLGAGMTMHYGMARYQLKDPGARPQLPDARQR